MAEKTELTLDEAVLAIMADVKYIKKTKENKQQGFKFASAEDIVHEIRQAALKHGVRMTMSYSDAVELEKGETKSGSAMYRVRVKGTLKLSKGSEKDEQSHYGEGADFGDKATAKAETACLKQALRQTFMIETGDHDPDKVDPTGGDSNLDKIKALPEALQNCVEWLRKRKYKDMSHQAFRGAMASIIDANNGDPEAIEGYFRSTHGWRGNVIASDLADEGMPK